jgi:hypothetical protein
MAAAPPRRWPRPSRCCCRCRPAVLHVSPILTQVRVVRSTRPCLAQTPIPLRTPTAVAGAAPERIRIWLQAPRPTRSIQATTPAVATLVRHRAQRRHARSTTSRPKSSPAWQRRPTCHSLGRWTPRRQAHAKSPSLRPFHTASSTARGSSDARTWFGLQPEFATYLAFTVFNQSLCAVPCRSHPTSATARDPFKMKVSEPCSLNYSAASPSLRA